MDTREAIGVIAVSLVPFLVSVGAVLSVGAPEMAISYRRFFASSQLTGPKGVRLSAVVHLLDHRVGICRDCPAGARRPFVPKLFT